MTTWDMALTFGPSILLLVPVWFGWTSYVAWFSPLVLIHRSSVYYFCLLPGSSFYTISLRLTVWFPFQLWRICYVYCCPCVITDLMPFCIYYYICSSFPGNIVHFILRQTILCMKTLLALCLQQKTDRRYGRALFSTTRAFLVVYVCITISSHDFNCVLAHDKMRAGLCVRVVHVFLCLCIRQRRQKEPTPTLKTSLSLSIHITYEPG